MVKRLLSLFMIAGFLLLGVTAYPAFAAPPPNDDPAGAELIPSAGPFPYYSAVTPDITDATITGEPVPGCAFNGSFSRSIWYVFTPPYSTSYVVATDVSGTTVVDTILAVYTSAGGAGGPFTQVACDDDSGVGLQSRLTTSLTANTTYWIQVSEFGTTPPATGQTAIQLLVDTAWPLSTPLTTAFTYQGALNRDGQAVTAACDLRFTLFDAATGGIQRGLPQTLPAVAVTNGLFTVDLDFGDLFRGDRLWLETAVQCAGDPGLTVLSPRQALNAAPYAQSLRPGAEVRGSIAGPALKVANPSYPNGVGFRAEGFAAAIQASGTAYGLSATSSAGIAISGSRDGTAGTDPAIYGATFSTSANAAAILGQIVSSAPGGSSAAVRGTNNGAGGSGVGVWGEQMGTGYGVLGYTPNGGYGVVGNNGGSNTSGYAGFFTGRVLVQGNFSVTGSKAFQIDHPLDPANKYLYHFAVESPEVRNQYQGVVTLDAAGQAVVALPDYFDALNADEGITYQLTCIGGYAPVYVAREVAGNTFTIGGGTAGLKVSWQVTAVRDDPYLHANRLAAEVDKTAAESGKYLYPQGYGKSADQSILNNQAAHPSDPGLAAQAKEGAGKADNR
jgi:hypothetical protein